MQSDAIRVRRLFEQIVAVIVFVMLSSQSALLYRVQYHSISHHTFLPPCTTRVEVEVEVNLGSVGRGRCPFSGSSGT